MSTRPTGSHAEAGEGRALQLRPGRREVLLVSCAVLGALSALAFAGPIHPGLPLVFWFGACVIGERLWVRLPLGGATISMAGCFNFAATLLLSRTDAMVAIAVSTVVSERWFMRKPAHRVIFNASQSMLASAAASALLAALLPAGSTVTGALVRFEPAPILVAAIAYAVVNTGSVALAVALCERLSPWSAWARLFGNGLNLSIEGASLSLGVLVAVHVTQAGLTATALALCPLVVAHQAYRMYLARGQARPDDDSQSRAA
jgi:hypothetical protein